MFTETRKKYFKKQKELEEKKEREKTKPIIQLCRGKGRENLLLRREQGRGDDLGDKTEFQPEIIEIEDRRREFWI